MDLFDWIHACELYLTEQGAIATTNSKRVPSVQDFMRSCMSSIQTKGCAYDVEISFLYILCLVTTFLDKCKTPVSEDAFVSLFAVSTCVYDKLTNDWPRGTVFFCHFLNCTYSAMFDHEMAFVKEIGFDLCVSPETLEQTKECLFQRWIAYRLQFALDHTPTSEQDPFLCQEDVSFMYF